MLISLKESLQTLVVPAVKHFSGFFPDAASNGRKDQLIDRISSAMLGPQLRSMWAQLDATQAAAVAEAIHHPLGEFSLQRFQAKYQAAPRFELLGDRVSQYGNQNKTVLALFIHVAARERIYFVPFDLRVCLLAFVPRPNDVQLPSSDERPVGDELEKALTERLTENDALQEVVVMLRTIESSRLTVGEKTALPSASTVKALGDKLVAGDFYAPEKKANKWDQAISPIKAFAWAMLLQASGLAQRTGTRLALSPGGIKALSAPPAEALRTAWRKWLKTTLLDEFSRVDAIKGQGSSGRVMSAVTPRRDAIEAALQDCPVGRWVSFDDFSRYMRAAEHDFVVAHDPWKLYLGDRQYGSLGYEGGDGWNILQDRYIAVVLFEYAATLGMIDVAYRDPGEAKSDFGSLWGADELAFLSQYDGLHSFRVTALGAYLLGRVESYLPSHAPSNVALSVMPSLNVKRVRGVLSAQDSFLLELWAEQIEPDLWRLDRQKAAAAIERGHDMGVLRQFLEAHDELPLPELVDSFLKRCASDGRALETGASATLIECRDAETGDIVATHKETSSLCLRAGPKILVVRNEHLAKFRLAVNVIGLGLVA